MKILQSNLQSFKFKAFESKFITNQSIDLAGDRNHFAEKNN